MKETTMDGQRAGWARKAVNEKIVENGLNWPR